MPKIAHLVQHEQRGVELRARIDEISALGQRLRLLAEEEPTQPRLARRG